MNIWGYQRTLKKISRTLDAELKKDKYHQSAEKIRRLRLAKTDCSNRIKELRKNNKKKVKKN